LAVQPLEGRAVPATVTNTNDSGAGSLRQAILDTNNSPGADTIDFDATVFATRQTITLTTGQLSITDALTIIGPSAAESRLTVSGNSAGRVFNIAVGAATVVNLTDLTIRSGKVTNANGGGILMQNGAVTLTNCDVMSNSAVGSSSFVAAGGGIRADAGTLTLVGCLIGQNTAATSGVGGGVSTAGAGMTMTNCIVTGNTAINNPGSYDSGGGCIYSSAGALTLTDCAVSGNGMTAGSASTRYGGGIFSRDNVMLTRCDISGNSATLQGGGLFIFNKTGTLSLTLDETTVDGNQAATGGAGISMGCFPAATAAATITNSTISNNSSSGGFGGGIGVQQGAVRLTVISSTISSNKTGNAGGGIAMFGTASGFIYNSTIAFNASTGNNGGGIVVSAPVTLRSCIVAKNSAAGSGPDISGTVTANFSFVGDQSGATLTLPSGEGDANPLPGDPKLGTLDRHQGKASGPKLHSLLTGSPAIETGTLNVATLKSAVTAAATTLDVVTNQSLTPGIFVRIDTEVMQIVSVSGQNSVTVARGQLDTTAAAHATSTAVNLVVDRNVTTLAQPASASDTQITVASTALLVVGEYVRIEEEILRVAAFTPATGVATVARGQLGTTTAAHASGRLLRTESDQRGPGFARLVDADAIAPGSFVDIGAYELQRPPLVSSIVTFAENSNAVVVNSGSRTTKIEITFNQSVTFSGQTAAAFTLERTGPGTPTGAVMLSAAFPAGGSVVTLTFSGTFTQPEDKTYHSLIDGKYLLTIDATQVSSAAGFGALDGDNNGVAGGNKTFELQRLFGDFDGDGDVDAADFAAFRAAFGTNNPIFDFDGDGDVDAADFAAFRARFGTSL
jgi:hypothetical protein